MRLAVIPELKVANVEHKGKYNLQNYHSRIAKISNPSSVSSVDIANIYKANVAELKPGHRKSPVIQYS